ncbi:MAG: GDP-mannose 4,6-dehydratase [Acidobacteria bacterium]|nr:GDP-mannose 4,6-dehydratase [Acidobacteriota bacterium]
MTPPGAFWKEKSVFVTGATGLVGSWLVRDLVDCGAKVVALVLDADPYSELYLSGCVQRVHVVNGRLEDYSTVERAIVAHECDTIFHLGAQAIVSVAQRSPLATLETNVRGTWNVLEACRLHGDLVKRVVVASSDKAYGENPTLPYTEEMPLQGRQPYEVSKSCADLIAQSYFHSYSLPVAVARCGNIFGGGDLNWTRIVPGTIRALYRGEAPLIRSDGRYVRDYLYVKDVSCAYLSLAEHLSSKQVSGESFNFSPESQVAVLEIVDKIRRLMKCEHIQPNVLNLARGEIRNQYLSSEKSQRILHWRAAYSLERGLAETIDWYTKFFAEGRS